MLFRSQTIPSTALTVDGNWTTRTTVTDPAGNAGVPQTGAFVLDTSAPGVPGVALPEALNGVKVATITGLSINVAAGMTRGEVLSAIQLGMQTAESNVFTRLRAQRVLKAESVASRVLDANGHIRSVTTGYTTELGMRARLWWASLY